MDDGPLVRLLGGISIHHHATAPSVPARLDRVVLAHLALAEGRSVPAADLIDAIWGEAPPVRARNALQVKVSRLRRQLGAHGPALQHRQGTYRLDLPTEEIDVRLFVALSRAASDAHARGQLDIAVATAERALTLWQGPPLPGLDDHPRLVAARALATEQHMALRELVAEAAIGSGLATTQPIETLRALLAEDPLRPRARLLLMRALEQQGRRAEAIAVYDVGRRVLAEQTGLAPPEELQHEFERLLVAERRAAKRELDDHRTPSVPPGAVATARWLAQEGAVQTAVELALRGAWWWWLGGGRSAGRDLLEDLVGMAAADAAERSAVLGATAWLAVFDSVSVTAREAIAAGEDALREAGELGWGRHESLAAVLLAERLFQRGEPRRGSVLLRGARAGFAALDDSWGLALVGLIGARADLQRGWVARAAAGARSAQRAFESLGDAAGQMMAMDLLGYCSEVMGDLPQAARTHRRALTLARDVGALAWQATQLTRLGSVQALLGQPTSLTTLRQAIQQAESVGSAAGVALARNALALARGLAGDHDEAAEVHALALAWYEQQGSQAGVSYTAGRLALELAATKSPDAARLAARSLRLARHTTDPRAIAHSLEAVALIHDDPVTRARALGAARALRRRTGSPLPGVLAASVDAAQRRLGTELGEDLLSHVRAGAREAQLLVRAPDR